MINELGGLESTLGVKFRNKNLLLQAVTHASAVHQNYLGKFSPNYERLELLGDSLLKLIATEHVYYHFPNAEEGELSDKRQQNPDDISLYLELLVL